MDHRAHRLRLPQLGIVISDVSPPSFSFSLAFRLMRDETCPPACGLHLTGKSSR